MYTHMLRDVHPKPMMHAIHSSLPAAKGPLSLSKVLTEECPQRCLSMS